MNAYDIHNAIPWDNTGLFFLPPALPEVTELTPIEALLAWSAAGGDPTLLTGATR